MNTSSDRHLSSHALVQDFRYPTISPQRFAEGPILSFGSQEVRKSNDAILEQELAAAVVAARKEGVQDGLAQANAAMVQAIEQERSALAAALADFSRQRVEYFRRIEGDAVRLALLIARKILHREAQMDPLLLAGIVRVALDQMQAGTRVVLRTSPELVDSWSKFCSTHLQDKHSIEVVADPAMEAYQCALQAEAGSAEISLDAQLTEIEAGFFELLREKAVEPQ
jgi:flagellar assembly protein FliH